MGTDTLQQALMCLLPGVVGLTRPQPVAHRTTRYCTLKSWCGSIQTCATVKPAAAASRANAGGAYLYELSVQMLSPRKNENALSSPALSARSS